MVSGSIRHRKCWYSQNMFMQAVPLLGSGFEVWIGVRHATRKGSALQQDGR